MLKEAVVIVEAIKAEQPREAAPLLPCLVCPLCLPSLCKEMTCHLDMIPPVYQRILFLKDCQPQVHHPQSDLHHRLCRISFDAFSFSFSFANDFINILCNIASAARAVFYLVHEILFSFPLTPFCCILKSPSRFKA